MCGGSNSHRNNADDLHDNEKEMLSLCNIVRTPYYHLLHHRLESCLVHLFLLLTLDSVQAIWPTVCVGTQAPRICILNLVSYIGPHMGGGGGGHLRPRAIRGVENLAQNTQLVRCNKMRIGPIELFGVSRASLGSERKRQKRKHASDPTPACAP